MRSITLCFCLLQFCISAFAKENMRWQESWSVGTIGINTIKKPESPEDEASWCEILSTKKQVISGIGLSYRFNGEVNLLIKSSSPYSSWKSSSLEKIETAIIEQGLVHEDSLSNRVNFSAFRFCSVATQIDTFLSLFTAYPELGISKELKEFIILKQIPEMQQKSKATLEKIGTD